MKLKELAVSTFLGNEMIFQPTYLYKRGIPKSTEHKQNISKSNLGKTKGIPRGPQSEEHKRKRGEGRAHAWQRLRDAKGELLSL